MDWQLTGVLLIVLLAAGAVIRSFSRRHTGCASCASSKASTCTQGSCCCATPEATASLKPLEDHR
jgi:hypothetical protein